MKEKIWMEKLIDLLNEFEKKERKSEYYEWEKWIWWPNNLFRRDTRDEEWSHLYSDTADSYVISKKFWFIRWLCDNNKINTDIVYQKGFLAKTYDKDEAWECFEPYEEILMLLSISDEPIDFLCSILKEWEKKESEWKLVKWWYASFNEYWELMEADTLQELKDLWKI